MDNGQVGVKARPVRKMATIQNKRDKRTGRTENWSNMLPASNIETPAACAAAGFWLIAAAAASAPIPIIQ